MTRIKVDFNNLARNGQVRASLRNADGDVREGDLVEAFDPDDDLTYDATVVEVDEGRGRVYLQPHWEPAVPSDQLRPWIASAVQVTSSVLKAVSATTVVYRAPHVTRTPPPATVGTLTTPR